MSRFHIEADYAALHSSFPNHKRKPIIGITGNYDSGKCTLLEGYYRSVLEAGGTPLIIPPCDDTDAMVSLLDRVDALILSGGGDINPLYLGEEPLRELSSRAPCDRGTDGCAGWHRYKVWEMWEWEGEELLSE